MRCEDVSKALPEIVDGAATADLTLRRHVDTCLRCQAELAQYRRLLRSLHHLRTEVLEPAPGLLSDILARVEEAGEVVLPGRLLLEIVRALPPGEVTIAQPGGAGAAQLECGASRYSLNTQNAEDFPQLPAPTGTSFAVDRQAFVDTVAHVGRAASKDESRPVLTGVLVELGEGRVTMAATDS